MLYLLLALRTFNMKTINIKTANIVFVLALFITTSWAQQFTPINAGLDGFKNADLQWGDYDNDNDLDLLVVGRKMINPSTNTTAPASEIYRNDGDDIFTNINAGISGVYNGYATWGDFDNDNDLDVLVSGKLQLGSLTTITQVFVNEGTNTFTLQASLDSLENTFADWGDVNNDGFLDILLTGDKYINVMSYNPLTILYVNNQNGGFTIANTSIADISYGSCNIEDFDNDGDMDIFISGVGSQAITSILYENHDGAFVNTNQIINGFTKGASAWSDYDNDGDYDLIVAGAEGGVSASATTLYKNTDNVFTEVSILGGDTLPPLSFPSVDWGDYDNDGDMDILLSGQIGLIAERYTGIFRNDGNDYFTEITSDLVPVRSGDAKWGDYDGDGDLDIALCGTDTTGTFGEYVTKIYRNDLIGSANNSPESPTGLFAEAIDNKILFYWDPGSDEETPLASLNYNICIGSDPGLTDIVSPMTILETGNRAIKHFGNAGMNTFYLLEGNDQSQFYWKVQTLDGSFIGSEFTEEQLFDLNAVRIDNMSTKSERIKVFPNPANDNVQISFISEKDTFGIIQFLDQEGQLLIEREIQLITGENLIKIPVNKLSAGVYIYKLTSGNFSHSDQIIIQPH